MVSELGSSFHPIYFDNLCLTLGILRRESTPLAASRYGIPANAPAKWNRFCTVKAARTAADTVLNPVVEAGNCRVLMTSPVSNTLDMASVLSMVTQSCVVFTSTLILILSVAMSLDAAADDWGIFSPAVLPMLCVAARVLCCRWRCL